MDPFSPEAPRPSAMIRIPFLFAVAAVVAAAPALAQGQHTTTKPGQASSAQSGAEGAAKGKPGAKPETKGKGDAKGPAGGPGGGSATRLAEFGDWGAYATASGKARVCYALSQPKDRQ